MVNRFIYSFSLPTCFSPCIAIEEFDHEHFYIYLNMLIE